MEGKEVQEGGDICIHTADSLCCTAETHTTVLVKQLRSIYWNIEKKSEVVTHIRVE